ncbi:response regulator transcription factor [Pelomonas sp. P7]|uniref:Response regulator transcription factor n=1 Tax=Pelomonas caseinilytica TaxID=2906763 RepID=A0ABS8XNV3_9BURK|nr:helix-turn-helix transcriptional regulator [Pelomonas sp. P7]MCE4540246.1 response regulator transcription factor [Pelomonas sp. P7]
MHTLSPDDHHPWTALFGPCRAELGERLGAAGASAPAALRAAWLIEVERLPHEADRLLRREPLADAGLRDLLAAASARMYDDAAATAGHAARALARFADPLHPLHAWAACLQGQAQLELGWPARALAPLQAALRGAHRDGLALLQLDALLALARAHDELGDAAQRDAVLADAAPLAAAHAALPAADSLRRLQAQLAGRAALVGGPPPHALDGEGRGVRLARAWQAWLEGAADAPGLAAEVAALRQLQRQQYWPLKWQVDLGQLEGALAARAGRPVEAPVLAPEAPHGLARLQAAVLDAGHARLAGRPAGGAGFAGLAEELAERGLQRLAARLALVRADDGEALARWWRLPARDTVDALWLAPVLWPLWPALLASADPRRSAASQQALARLGERLPGPRREPAASAPVPLDLTPREWQVLQLIAEDWSNAQIAARLFVSEATVKTHINRVYAKLGLRDRREAMLRARALGA